jgi:hypothetical protein
MWEFLKLCLSYVVVISSISCNVQCSSLLIVTHNDCKTFQWTLNNIIELS